LADFEPKTRRIGIWPHFIKLLKQRIELLLGNLGGNSSFEFRVDIVINSQWVLRHFEREINIGILPGKTRRQHAKNGVILMNQLDVFPDNIRITIKVTPPERI